MVLVWQEAVGTNWNIFLPKLKKIKAQLKFLQRSETADSSPRRATCRGVLEGGLGPPSSEFTKAPLVTCGLNPRTFMILFSSRVASIFVNFYIPLLPSVCVLNFGDFFLASLALFLACTKGLGCGNLLLRMLPNQLFLRRFQISNWHSINLRLKRTRPPASARMGCALNVARFAAVPGSKRNSCAPTGGLVRWCLNLSGCQTEK